MWKWNLAALSHYLDQWSFINLWVGGRGLFLRWWPPSTMWVGPLIFSNATTRDVWIVRSCLRICGYVLHVKHISCDITNCGQHQWIIPSPFSIALYALLDENITRKITIPTFRLVLQNFAVSGCFSFILCYFIISIYIFLIDLLLQYVALFLSVNC